MKADIEELIEIASESDISSIQSVLTQLIEVVNSPQASALELKNLIEIDPPLTARILKRANSAFYGAKRRMAEILDAVICIGFEAVKELALNQKVCELFTHSDVIHGYSRNELWKHSVAVALCAKLIYRREMRLSGGDVYTAGLLHDMGIIALDQFMHEPFTEVLQYMSENGVHINDAEMHVLGFTHAEVGSRLAETWAFPERLCRVIATDEHPERADTSNARMSTTLYIANCACRRKRMGFAEEKQVDSERYRGGLDQLGLTELGIQSIMTEVSKDIQEMQRNGWF
jgi:HD-like signal output (HDOD) protein